MSMSLKRIKKQKSAQMTQSIVLKVVSGALKLKKINRRFILKILIQEARRKREIKCLTFENLVML